MDLGIKILTSTVHILTKEIVFRNSWP